MHIVALETALSLIIVRDNTTTHTSLGYIGHKHFFGDSYIAILYRDSVHIIIYLTEDTTMILQAIVQLFVFGFEFEKVW